MQIEAILSSLSLTLALFVFMMLVLYLLASDASGSSILLHPRVWYLNYVIPVLILLVCFAVPVLYAEQTYTLMTHDFAQMQHWFYFFDYQTVYSGSESNLHLFVNINNDYQPLLVILWPLSCSILILNWFLTQRKYYGFLPSLLVTLVIGFVQIAISVQVQSVAFSMVTQLTPSYIPLPIPSLVLLIWLPIQNSWSKRINRSQILHLPDVQLEKKPKRTKRLLLLLLILAIIGPVGFLLVLSPSSRYLEIITPLLIMRLGRNLMGAYPYPYMYVIYPLLVSVIPEYNFVTLVTLLFRVSLIYILYRVYLGKMTLKKGIVWAFITEGLGMLQSLFLYLIIFQYTTFVFPAVVLPIPVLAIGMILLYRKERYRIH